MVIETKKVKSSKKPNPVDIHVGGRIRLQRTALRMSQEKLGEQLGITFQQIQKYEKGTNRVGASRLQHIASILGVPVSFFFDNAPDVTAQTSGSNTSSDSNAMLDFIATREGVELCRAFAKISDPKIRAKTVQLVKAMAEGMDA